jgi:hypothetical protein
MNQKEILVEVQVKETSKVYQTSSGIPRMVYIYIYIYIYIKEKKNMHIFNLSPK